MRATVWSICSAALAGCGFFIGCERAAVRHDYPPDPLLASKKPVESKAQNAPPVQVAHLEPPAPALPETALASAPASLRTPALVVSEPRRDATPGKLDVPIPATPVSLPTASREVVASPAVRRQVDGVYGHASDYTWLQGVLDRHYRGHYYLRYCDATTEDKWGGKVHLEEDPRLAQFKEGDIVAVEGEIIHENGQPLRGDWHHYPRYRIRTISQSQSK